MRKIIHKLRQKPPHVRDQIAVFGALTFAGIVSFFWMFGLASDYGSQETKKSFSQSITSPFKILSVNFKSALDRSKAELSSIDPSNLGKSDKSINNSEVTVDQQGVVNLGVQQ